MQLPMIHHLFLTPRFLIKGRVTTAESRLSSFLNTYSKPHLAIDDVTLVDLVKQERVAAPRLLVRVRDIVLAHEYVDLAGDDVRRAMAGSEDRQMRMAALYFRPPSSWELMGRVVREVLKNTSTDGFFVVVKPVLRGLEEFQGRDFEQLTKLPYVIVNRAQIHCLLEYE